MPETVVDTVPINNLTHPLYKLDEAHWYKWRLTYRGGDEFINEYLRRFSKSEDSADFNNRRNITYVPAFAKVALIEVRNSIYQRLVDIQRVGGSPSYQNAIAGRDGGVDLLGSTMNTFMGIDVLEELLVVKKVGIYVDMPEKKGPTVAENVGVRPYLYVYKTEDIRSWDDDESPTPNQYRAVLLRDHLFVRDEATGLPKGETTRFRYYWRNENGEVWAQFFDKDGLKIFPDGTPNGDAVQLKISRIPFVCRELNSSLLADICNYQIALMNLASTDMAYAIGANFPFYTEQYDPRSEALHMKSAEDAVTVNNETGGVVEAAPLPANQNINVGPNSGRKYAKGLDRPDFVHPSTEPMRASMEKQEQLKIEIRLLLNLAITNIQPKMASAESKGVDVRTLESGLSYIGLILEDMERETAEIWHEYEGDKSPFKVSYPERYSLRNEKDVWVEVEQLKKHMGSVPSLTYKKTIAKRIAELLIGHRVTSVELDKIKTEIDKAKVVDVLVEKIEKDVTGGYLAKEYAAELRGYPEDSVEKAQKEQVERIKLIQLSQQKGAGTGAAANPDQPSNGGLQNPAARGLKDLSANPTQDVQAEKAAAGNPVRGPSKPQSDQ